MKRAFLLSCFIFLTAVAVNAQWTQRVTGMTNQSVGALYADTSTLYAGTITSVFKSTNLGVNWVSSSAGLPATTNFYSIVRSGNFLIAGGDASGIWRSSNNGATWVQTTSGVPTNQYTYTFYVEGNTVYAAFGFTSAVGISTDNGATWTKYTNGLTTTQTMTGVTKIGTNLFVCHQFLGVYISTNGGASWTLTAPISSQNKNALITSGTSLIVGASGGGSQNGVFRSTDLGTTWTKVRTGPLVTGFAKNGATLYSVGDSIHRSTNDGLTWTPVDLTGYPGSSVWNTIQFAGTFAFVNYFGVGVYRRPISELVSVREQKTSEVPNAFRLEQNYPNPFNPFTTISFSIPAGVRQNISLRVFDVAGKEVESLVDGVREAGTYKIFWDASNQPSGVYFYRLQTDRFDQTRSLILLK